MRGIAYRRHQRERARARVLRYFSIFDGDTDDRIVGIYINTRKPCTCLCCTNQREFFGETIGELKANDEFESAVFGRAFENDPEADEEEIINRLWYMYEM